MRLCVAKGLAIILCAALSVSACARERSAEPLMLFSAEEAQELDLDGLNQEEWHRYVNQYFMGTRALTKGPKINLEKPAAEKMKQGLLEIYTHNPVEFHITFLDSTAGNPPEMATLKVVGKKGFIKKDITDKLTPYISGTTIEATDIELPKMKFQLVIAIQDTAGNKTEQSYLVRSR